MRHIHLIGIGGTGLSAIARVLLERGFDVSGSDREASPLFNQINSAGARTYIGHAARQIDGADLVIRSSAIPDDNPEVIAARVNNIPVLKRSEFLLELTSDKDTLAVAGSHGKTTTTAMLAWVLDQLGTDPSFIVGGMVNQLACNARSGAGLYFVIEADEYDFMFLGLSPKIAIITNIEHDHPDCFPTEEGYRAAFEAFLERVRPDGLALLCRDDPATQTLMEKMHSKGKNLLGYGSSPDSNYQADEISLENGKPQFRLRYHTKQNEPETLGVVTLSVPGLHNVLNATAVLGTIHQLGLPLAEAINAIGKFTGAGRRFEILGTVNGTTIIDDYGHHPTEIAATLEAARSRYPHQRIWAVWQPHTFSRTQNLKTGFVRALNLADRVVVLKIYAARESDPGVTAEPIVDALTPNKGVYINTFEDANDFIFSNLSPGDVVIVFSAGDATRVSQNVFDRLKLQEQHEKELNQ